MGTIKTADLNALKRKMCAGRGHRLEATVIASMGSIILVEKMPTGGQWRRGGPQLIKGPVDYVGTIRETGRAIMFDAKECSLQHRYDVGNRDHLASHQREFLIRQGGAGAIAGVLVEGTHPDVEAYFWLPWRELLKEDASIPWGDARLINLGSNKLTINFRRVPGVVGSIQKEI